MIDRVQETYKSELDSKDFAYDGEKSLFTVGSLPRNKLEFTVVLEDISSNRCVIQLLIFFILLFLFEVLTASCVYRNNGNASPGHDNDSDRKRMRRPYQSKSYKVEISFAAKIPMQAIANALRGQESENSQEALRVLDIILRQHAAKQ